MNIDPGARLVGCPPAALRGNMPSPVSERLDVLVSMAEGAGAATNRGELIAALVLAAPETSDELLQLWLTYRRSVARDAGIAGMDPARVLRFERHPPGRRRKPGSAGAV